MGLPVPENVTYLIPNQKRKKGAQVQMATMTPAQRRILQELAWATHREWQALSESVTPFTRWISTPAKRCGRPWPAGVSIPRRPTGGGASTSVPPTAISGAWMLRRGI